MGFGVYGFMSLGGLVWGRRLFFAFTGVLHMYELWRLCARSAGCIMCTVVCSLTTKYNTV